MQWGRKSPLCILNKTLVLFLTKRFVGVRGLVESKHSYTPQLAKQITSHGIPTASCIKAFYSYSFDIYVILLVFPLVQPAVDSPERSCMKKITYEVWARPGQEISAETNRLFEWYQKRATQLKLDTHIIYHKTHITLLVYIKTNEGLQRYDTLYRECICHPERSKYYEKRI